MDDLPEGDFDSIVRLKCIDLANDIADRALSVGNFMMGDPETLIAAAEVIEHYVTQGGTIAFDLRDKDRKFVRGE